MSDMNENIDSNKNIDNVICQQKKLVDQIKKLQRKYSSIEKAVDYLERIKWENGKTCPHCNRKDKITNRKPYNRLKTIKTDSIFKYSPIYFCTFCENEFCVYTGTVLQFCQAPTLINHLIIIELVLLHMENIVHFNKIVLEMLYKPSPVFLYRWVNSIQEIRENYPDCNNLKDILNISIKKGNIDYRKRLKAWDSKTECVLERVYLEGDRIKYLNKMILVLVMV